MAVSEGRPRKLLHRLQELMREDQRFCKKAKSFSPSAFWVVEIKARFRSSRHNQVVGTLHNTARTPLSLL